MEPEKISEIIDPNFKNGIGKNNKPWYLIKIVTNSGKAATVFGPANVGDEVELEYNDQYKNYSGKVKQNSHRTYQQAPNDDAVLEALRKMWSLMDEISKDVKELKGETTSPTSNVEEAQAAQQAKRDQASAREQQRAKYSAPAPKEEPLPEYPGEEEVNLNDIPW